MSFTNLYYKRTAATAKACFVCYKPTNTVLATINTIDFLYTCPVHLTDHNFASPLGESGDGLGSNGSRKMGLSTEEIAKVKEEWEERQKKKLENEKAKQKEGKGKEKEKDKDKDKDEDKNKEEKETKEVDKPSSATSALIATPTHQRFTLHRDFFAMRLSEHRKRRQVAQVKELAPRLPGAPRGSLPNIS